MALQITKSVREQIPFNPTLFSMDGKIRFNSLRQTRQTAQLINNLYKEKRPAEKKPSAGTLNAIDLIDDIFHHLIWLYQTEKVPKLTSTILNNQENGQLLDDGNHLLEVLVTSYPPERVFSYTETPASFLKSETDGFQNRELILEDLILIWISTLNPAKQPYGWLLHAPELVEMPSYKPVMVEVESILAGLPKFGPEDQSLIEMLKSPAIHSPNSLTGQLEFIRSRWGSLLGDYLTAILKSLDLAREEEKITSMGAGPVIIPRYDHDEFIASGGRDIDTEAFSLDSDWMPRLVLIAKNVFVWMDQLSVKYGQTIHHLDQIPDEELATLANRGINGLWLIGLWQRSPASARIKQLCGNPEALASAYSLYSYQIADELGGETACENLKKRAAHYGIRMASDMVPNHMGIDSEWVINHPERFLSLDDCPYPAYRFTGQDLSNHPGVTLQIEDRYFDRADAAVVFRRIDNRDGSVKYIYHGNDGTSMPWNDTAQLNYLDANVREIVIQTILEVARRFPIIRFDAAMTLAKKHIQRLWFPEPGSGGAIPSRSENAISQADFDRALPREFWREVVERVEKEVPDTLLLAEAFWLMEGYFVRTLGMHRVYNSAFMHMLRDEDNAGYRKIVKNTLEFEPEILKRFVNFMNNPDERTAVDQFGKNDKYFAVCTLLATLPGLPMFGHGQFEGFTEKYGMEYRKAYQNESEDLSLLNRHEFEICPLLHQREIFAGVEHFRLFDFVCDHGEDENVFAYTNARDVNLTLVIVNNQYQAIHGSIKTSSPQLIRQQDQKHLLTSSVADCLGVGSAADGFITFRDQSTGLQYLRPVHKLQDHGFEINLNGYEHHVFLDFRWVHSTIENDYQTLFSQIGLQGVTSLEDSLRGLRLQPVLQPFRDLINDKTLIFGRNCAADPLSAQKTQFIRDFSEKLKCFYAGIQISTQIRVSDFDDMLRNSVRMMEALIELPHLGETIQIPGAKNLRSALERCELKKSNDSLAFTILFAWIVTRPLVQITGSTSDGELSLAIIEELQVQMRNSGVAHDEIQQATQTLRFLDRVYDWIKPGVEPAPQQLLLSWFSMEEVRVFTQVNHFEKIDWFNGERFNEFLWWIKIIAILYGQSKNGTDQSQLIETILMCDSVTRKIATRLKHSKYQVSKMIGN
jgi:glycosidase